MTAAPDPTYDGRVYGRVASVSQLREQKLTVADAAKILNISKMAVYRLVSPPKGIPPLRHYRFGNGRTQQIRIPLSAIREFLGESETGGEE